jgi:hypothetical protein
VVNGQSVQARRPEQIQLGVHLLDPPLEYDTARARDGESLAIPGWCCGVRGPGAVRAVVVDELL